MKENDTQKHLLRWGGKLIIFSIVVSILSLQMGSIGLFFSNDLCKRFDATNQQSKIECPDFVTNGTFITNNIMFFLVIGPLLFLLSYALVALSCVISISKVMGLKGLIERKSPFFLGLLLGTLLSSALFVSVVINLFFFSDVLKQKTGMRICPSCPELPVPVAFNAELFYMIFFLALSWLIMFFTGFFYLFVQKHNQHVVSGDKPSFSGKPGSRSKEEIMEVLKEKLKEEMESEMLREKYSG